MILLNILYGFVIALVAITGLACYKMINLHQSFSFDYESFFIIWIVWSGGHIVYDVAAHYLVKFFNRNRVYRG